VTGRHPRLRDVQAQGAASRRPLLFRTGPFTCSLTTSVAPVRDLALWAYGESEAPSDADYVHFHVGIRQTSALRRLLAPQAIFTFEDTRPFSPFPLDHGYALLEWGLNWCIAMRGHQYLMLHAGVVEREGQAMVFPAMPGSGKSTLTAALVYSGWRLLSDEFGLVDWTSGYLRPLPRAIPLKNASIGVIRDFAPQAAIGPVFPRTRKGDVAHLRPPAESLSRQQETARPRWIVFPRFIAGRPLNIRRLPKSLAFTRLAQNAFNYRLLGETGFRQLSALIQQCECLSVEYGSLDAVVPALDRLAAADTP